jgi:predicted transcriptional regulator
MATNYRELERIVRGYSNHRRIQILDILTATPEMDVLALARACRVNFRTASEHTGRLARAGLIFKRSKGRRVVHVVSKRGERVLAFLHDRD